MLDKREIDKEISRLEYEESSYPNYAKLAHLYVIRNQMVEAATQDGGYSFAAEAPPSPSDYYIVDVDPSSEFLEAVRGKDSRAAWHIMDELMDTLHVVNARVYNRVMDNIRNL